ncbi:serine hydrolase domain-containing protein [Hahella aquimaris]|uniref:serine hydrolase domain-containing protein n=1 Tax=Hahella sp. HNIBRBA332 TaxID=3015983 RepID=UPI00273A89B4|nr:serine hydrolase domain-containing protein [Hahella sp. HNIBRBA332]WLQ16018.1 serine hydrolase domain-containing protein [Hahella sp. HNIBRBA332]
MKLCIAFILSFLSAYALSATPFDTERFKKLLGAESPRDFSGVVLITQEGEKLFSYSSDTAATTALNAQGNKLELQSQFVIGSLSKQMTAVIILQLMEADKLKLDATLPASGLKLEETWADRVTVRQLLTHSSGVSIPGKSLLFEPGKGFAYSNYGFDLLGKLAETVSGRSYHQLTADLFKQCGMSHSFAGAKPARTDAPRLVAGFSEESEGLKRMDNEKLYQHLPSSGVVSSAADLDRWNACLHGGVLLKPEDYRQMVHASNSRQYRWGELGYGYGLQILEDKPLEFSHSGYVPGYISTLIYYPEKKISMVVLENISWSLKDLPRAFFPHDSIRKALRQSLN